MIIKKFKNTVHISIDKNDFKDYFEYDSMDSIKDLNTGKLFEYMNLWDVSIEGVITYNVGCLYDFICNGGEYGITLNYEQILNLLAGKVIITHIYY